jgi:hypothetical protein
MSWTFDCPGKEILVLTREEAGLRTSMDTVEKRKKWLLLAGIENHFPSHPPYSVQN